MDWWVSRGEWLTVVCPPLPGCCMWGSCPLPCFCFWHLEAAVGFLIVHNLSQLHMYAVIFSPVVSLYSAA